MVNAADIMLDYMGIGLHGGNNNGGVFGMKRDDLSIVELLKKFEVVNKEVIQLSQRLSKMKAECKSLEKKTGSSHVG